MLAIMSIQSGTDGQSLRARGLRVRALPSDLGERAAAAGHDCSGAPVQVWTDPAGGAPLRCCLRDSTPGEQLTLIAVVPDSPRRAYAERGPVYVHAQDCGGPPDDGAYPQDWRTRDQVLRAYGHDGEIVGGELVVAGSDQEAVAQRLLRDPTVAFLQTRNVVYGCYLATIVRRPAPDTPTGTTPLQG